MQSAKNILANSAVNLVYYAHHPSPQECFYE
jgi:hypothetical protein